MRISKTRARAKYWGFQRGRFGNKKLPIEFTFDEFYAWIVAQPDLCPCGEPATSVDHVAPIARGGRHQLGNFQMLCLACNCRKGAWLPDEDHIYPWQKSGWQHSLRLGYRRKRKKLITTYKEEDDPTSPKWRPRRSSAYICA